jgi:hypothetical protein
LFEKQLWDYADTHGLLRKADLRKRAKELGLSGYSGKHKSELVSMLRNH